MLFISLNLLIKNIMSANNQNSEIKKPIEIQKEKEDRKLKKEEKNRSNFEPKDESTKKEDHDQGILSRFGNVLSGLITNTKEVLFPDLSGKGESEKNKEEDKIDKKNKTHPEKVSEGDLFHQEISGHKPKCFPERSSFSIEKVSYPENKELSKDALKFEKKEANIPSEAGKEQARSDSKVENEDKTKKKDLNQNIKQNSEYIPLEKPEISDTTKYYAKTLSGRDSEQYQDTARNLPAPNMN